MDGSDLLLADEFFLTAHDAAGGALLSDRVLGLGLASAMLGELVFAGRVTVERGLLGVIDRRPLPEPLGASVLYQLLSEPGRHHVRAWMSYLARTADDSVGRRLAHHGHVRRVQRQRLLRPTVVTYQPINLALAASPPVRLQQRLTGRAPVPDYDVVLAGLILATGLDQTVLQTLNQTTRRHLIGLIGRLSPALRELLANAEAAVGEAVLSGRA
jgi:Golgi phosphoprotein 3 (GPP34)